MPELLGNTVEEKSRGRSWCPTGTSVTGAGTCLGTCPGVLVPAPGCLSLPCGWAAGPLPALARLCSLGMLHWKHILHGHPINELLQEKERDERESRTWQSLPQTMRPYGFTPAEDIKNIN